MKPHHQVHLVWASLHCSICTLRTPWSCLDLQQPGHKWLVYYNINKLVTDGDFSDFCPNCENLERHILQQHQCHRCKCGSSWFSAQGEICKTRLAIVALSTKPVKLGPRTKERGEEFGWDCDPLIPISVWVSVLVGHLSLLQNITTEVLVHIDTGWSKETVDCKFLLTDPRLPKSVITQWFLESLYREVLVFWHFKNARCVEFCLSEIFQ